MTITDLDRIRGMQLAHEALEQIIDLSERRRSNYQPPQQYPGDMSVINRRLDEILTDLEPPC